MYWRRGLLLAAINLAVAVPMVLWLDSMEAAFVRENQEHVATQAEAPPTATAQHSDHEDQGVSFSICSFNGVLPPQGEIVVLANIPANIVTGWRVVCPATWTLAGRLHAGGTWLTASMATQHKVDLGLIVLIALQWLLVGAFPLRRPKRPWGEPGMLITICAVLSAAVVFIRPLDDLAKLLAACAACVWLCWFGLLIWTVIRLGWTRARRLAARGAMGRISARSCV